MEFESPLSQFKAIKKAIQYFDLKVNNSRIKEQPLSRKDSQDLEIGVKALMGEIFWMRINAQRTKDKVTSKISIKGRPGIFHLFLSFVILLLSGPFLYMGLQSGNSFPYIASGVFFLIGLASIAMPFFRLRKVGKGLKAALISEEELILPEEVKTDKPITFRLNE